MNEIINKKILVMSIVFLLGIIFLGYFAIAQVAGEVVSTSYCCERTNDDTWCVDTPDQSECNTAYNIQPTGCASTSYCALGTCLDRNQGVCIENSPQMACNEEEGGFWRAGSSENIPECSLGCCLIGDQAAFVTGTRCRKLATQYGLDIDFRTDIQDEVTCISSARQKVMGACVFQEEFSRTCKMQTKEECIALGTETEFYENQLCTNPDLQTDCTPTEKTTCVEGKDEVFYLDSCGNLANIYNSNEQVNINNNYWHEIISKAESCGAGQANIGKDNACGNCDYYFGSTCKEERGDNYCADLNCKNVDINGDGTPEYEELRQGESVCASSGGTSSISVVNGIMQYEFNPRDLETQNLPGSRYFRVVCYDGEALVEPCADFRQEVCIQSADINNPRATETGGAFKTATCRVNRWKDCVLQTGFNDCENTDLRDCTWIDSGKVNCVPKFAPGLKFWSGEGITGTTGAGTPAEVGEAESVCALVNDNCVAEYKEKLWDSLFGIKYQKKGKDCFDKNKNLKPEWINSRRTESKALGDCGIKNNYAGTPGEKIGREYSVNSELNNEVGWY
ncbi:MAG TPA: hypothetical protein VJH65_00350 [Candidatus Nanoarchaeia archaeon]|nr:hypothetical protein [Candidatus Nanoarchaeia archaeon]